MENYNDNIFKKIDQLGKNNFLIYLFALFRINSNSKYHILYHFNILQ